MGVPSTMNHVQSKSPVGDLLLLFLSYFSLLTSFSLDSLSSILCVESCVLLINQSTTPPSYFSLDLRRLNCRPQVWCHPNQQHELSRIQSR